MKGILIAIVAAAALTSLTVVSCNKFNLDENKARAEARWEELGYKPVAYEGFQYDSGIPGYGGAKVWYTMRRVPDNGVTYSGYTKVWGNEPLQVYGPRAIDAIQPSRH